VKAGLQRQADAIVARFADAGQPDSSVVKAFAGNPAKALNLVDADALSANSAFLLYYPQFDPVRNDPRFVKLLETVGLTEAHARAQAWRAAHSQEKPEVKK